VYISKKDTIESTTASDSIQYVDEVSRSGRPIGTMMQQQTNEANERKFVICHFVTSDENTSAAASWREKWIVED
jgi:hypothetical protein